MSNTSLALQQDSSINQIVDGSSSPKATESFRITVNGIFPESEYERLFNGTLQMRQLIAKKSLKRPLIQ